MTDTPTVADLRSRLDATLGGAARAWLDQAVAEATANPAAAADETPTADATAPPADVRAAAPTWELRFAEAGRRCGPEHADAVRLLLLHAARADTATLIRLYDQGTAAERRAVLRGLPLLVPGPEALPLVDDALRTNDTRLLAAALGPYAATHLPAHAWRHAVLKCLFTGVPVDAVADLERRAHADDKLARMLADYVDERTAAGRPVPGDLHRVLAMAAPPEPPGLPDPAAAAAVTAPSTPIGEEQES
ncbi:EboA domain-containing protein [Streptomyces spectabilis]|uniref:Sugar phosphate isomerase n=1 Tax=Streptomyces spectabilis TaxID=68270 RepID=A0A516RG39_STRST|nr:EboA domain-containing protein [Streptomyces spectabilis]QDQ14623.1 sugar phosphate isomerase [Streptomyces spectabilis]